MPHTQRKGTSETENDAIADSLAERSIRIAIHVRRARPCGAGCGCWKSGGSPFEAVNFRRQDGEEGIWVNICRVAAILS